MCLPDHDTLTFAGVQEHGRQVWERAEIGNDAMRIRVHIEKREKREEKEEREKKRKEENW